MFTIHIKPLSLNAEMIHGDDADSERLLEDNKPNLTKKMSTHE